MKPRAGVKWQENMMTQEYLKQYKKIQETLPGFENYTPRSKALWQLIKEICEKTLVFSQSRDDKIIWIEENLEAICYLAAAQLPPEKPGPIKAIDSFLHRLYLSAKTPEGKSGTTFGSEFTGITAAIKGKKLIVGVPARYAGHWIGKGGVYVKRMKSDMLSLGLDFEIKAN